MFKKARYILRYRYIALVGRAIFWYIARRAIFWYIARVIWKRVVNYGSRLEIMAAFIMCAYGNQNPVKYVLLNRLIWNLDTSSRVVSCFWCQNYDVIVPVRAQHWRSEVTARFWILLPSPRPAGYCSGMASTPDNYLFWESHQTCNIAPTFVKFRNQQQG